MARRLIIDDPDFESRFAEFLGAKREQSEDVDEAAREIIRDVRERGDAALIDYTRRFDKLELSPEKIRLSADEIDAAVAAANEDDLHAMRFAAERIEAYHRRQLPADDLYTDSCGAEMGHRWTAVEAAGIYVPGGQGSYPSSVLMNAIPAKVAGVPRIAMCVPALGGAINPLVLAAASLAGVDEIYPVGGAQAIAALAFGTESIRPVAKIMGPGNAYVAAAKRQVFGTVGIDMIAGPSEVLIVADKASDPRWVAADLLAQAEHDEAAQAILITDDAGFADAVEAAVTQQLARLPRAAIAGASWRDNGAVILVRNFDQAPALVDRIAPEHLELEIEDADEMLGKIRNAGSIFLGRMTPEAIGDYVAGPNHVLPTARSARFSSGLSVLDFMKRSSILRLTERSLAALGPAAMTLASVEGFDAHRRSIAIRLGMSDTDQPAS
ncbi:MULTISPECIES: histidinol dehydrogenase [Rhodomicrobium]|uniref:histidinol dehydrogenase n=1 Tax=Rhodomicrobium TaxID=1068 RepID=UPI000B4BBB6C|nr:MULTISPECIES: histidinol dehydrogenase [Rhodomicrobium]